jgi:Mn2+/Fe2+ NRAMP family transporter
MLSLQLPLAMIPLLRFASDAGLMGRWRIKRIPIGWGDSLRATTHALIRASQFVPVGAIIN